MIIDNLFSRLCKNNDTSDIFVYDEISEKLKITLYKIFKRAIKEIVVGKYDAYNEEMSIYHKIHEVICEEHSFHHLTKKPYEDHHYKENVIEFFNINKELLIALDMVQLFCMIIEEASTDCYNDFKKNTLLNFLNEINQRMKEHSFGYQYENKTIVRMDTVFTHSQIVKPSLRLLNNKAFKNADSEYRKAFEAFKNGDYEVALVECNKSFESTMKIICNIQKYSYKDIDTASKLIKILIDNGFIEKYNEDMLNGLEKVLISLPTLRNRKGGHGSGAELKEVNLSYINFALHLTASNILFLMERFNELNGK